MELLVGFALIIAQIIMGICIFKTSKEKHKLSKTVRRILQIGFVIVLCYMSILFTKQKAIALFAYSIYFVSADWVLYHLFRFSMEYIGSEFEKHVNKKAMIALLTVDSISLLLNNAFEHLFSVDRFINVNSEMYYMLDVKLPFYMHYAIILMLVTFSLISLFYRAFNAPYFYRKKYLLIGLILIAIVVVNFIFKEQEIDYSVIGYAIEAVCIYYCVFVYTPQRLMSKTLFMVAKDMSVALFVMDIDGKVIYSNNYAEKLLSNEDILINEYGMSLEEWCCEQYMDYEEDFTKERTFYREDEEVILKIQLQRMMDGKKQLQGGYFVIQDSTEEYKKLKKERYMATHDSLTGLYNKEYFYEKAERYIKRNPNEELLMICTDIKDFKMINDFFGTKVGDHVLMNFADMLKNYKDKAITFGRIGNDIFGILMPKENYNEDEFVKNSHEAFASCMNKSVEFPTINYIGVYEITESDLPVSVMCDRARMAIESIKGDYHKKVAYYDKKLRENILHEQELVKNLDKAIAEEELKMYLQPQMSPEGKILGAEALVRWIHPEKGQIMPGDFIPVFEKKGLISDVDRYIWETACKQLKKWKDEGKTDLYISVNISPRDFYFLNIYQVFVDLIEKYDIDPKTLKLEITETAVVMDFNRQLELINRLRQSGFVVEMDDFGSGYSSLNMLKDIHVDILKIDMAFLKKTEHEERSKKILQMIISLSKQLEMPVITEGVENAEQVRYLTEMGCQIFQGYYFAKPMNVDDFEKMYEKQYNIG